MKKEELIPEKVYYSGYGKYNWLVEFIGIDGENVVVNRYLRYDGDRVLGYSHNRQSWGSFDTLMAEFREAYTWEIAWLEACKAKGERAEKPKIIDEFDLIYN